MNRREFLQFAALAAAGALVPPGLLKNQPKALRPAESGDAFQDPTSERGRRLFDYLHTDEAQKEIKAYTSQMCKTGQRIGTDDVIAQATYDRAQHGLFGWHETQAGGVDYRLAFIRDDYEDWSTASMKTVNQLYLYFPMGFQGIATREKAHQARLADEGTLISCPAVFNENADNPLSAWSDKVAENNQALAITGLFSPGNEPDRLKNYKGPTNTEAYKELVGQHMDERARSFLNYLVKHKLQGRTSIELADQPFINGGWVDNSYFKAFGDKWITEAYVRLYRMAVDEFNLSLGHSFQIVGLKAKGAELPGEQADFVVSEVNRMKQEIAARLGIEAGDVPFDVGVEYRMGSVLPYSLLRSLENRVAIMNHLKNLGESTGSSIHVGIGSTGSEKQTAEAISLLLPMVNYSGVIGSLTLLNNDREQIPLFNRDHSKNLPYYALVSSLMHMHQGS